MKMRNLSNNKDPLKYLNKLNMESKSSFNRYLSNLVKKRSKRKFLKIAIKMKKIKCEQISEKKIVDMHPFSISIII